MGSEMCIRDSMSGLFENLGNFNADISDCWRQFFEDHTLLMEGERFSSFPVTWLDSDALLAHVRLAAWSFYNPPVAHVVALRRWVGGAFLVYDNEQRCPDGSAQTISAARLLQRLHSRHDGVLHAVLRSDSPLSALLETHDAHRRALAPLQPVYLSDDDDRQVTGAPRRRTAQGLDGPEGGPAPRRVRRRLME